MTNPWLSYVPHLWAHVMRPYIRPLSVVLFLLLSRPLQAEPIWARQGMVASDHALASAAGVEILKQGGNAIDATVATAFALGVVRPYSTGIGGGGFMVIHLQNGQNTVVDYREKAPLKAHRNMYIDKHGNVIPNKSSLGHLAVAIPGTVDGLLHALETHGTLSRKQVMAPAIRYAEQGIPVDANFVKSSTQVAQLLKKYPASARIFLKNGHPLALGDRLIQSDLARSLKLIAEKGRKPFYEGELAQAIAKEMQGKGLITLADLKHYHHRVLKPVEGTYRGYQVIAMPPPSSGGTTIIEILNILENYNLSWNWSGHNSSPYIHLLAESMKHAFSDRAEFLGDPDFAQVPLERLTAKSYARELSKKILRYQILPRQAYGHFAIPDDGGTTHFSVIDRLGNAVACTETVNTLFGSKVVVSGTGIVLNNEMDDFSAQPGTPNHYGLIGSEANAIAPGKAPLSSMSPTIVLKEGHPILIVGASGGPRIITATLQTILNVLDFDMPLDNAIATARIHHQWVPEVLMLEEGIALDVIHNLKQLGHQIQVGIPRSAVQAIHIKEGVFYGASDPRKGGYPVGY